MKKCYKLQDGKMVAIPEDTAELMIKLKLATIWHETDSLLTIKYKSGALLPCLFKS